MSLSEHIKELLVKEKGYFLQNKMYQRRIAFDFTRTSELRKLFMSKSKNVTLCWGQGLNILMMKWSLGIFKKC